MYATSTSILFIRKLKVLSNSTLQIVFGKRRQECSTMELHSLANMLTPAQMAMHLPSCLLQKVLAMKAPRDLYKLAMSQVSYKEKTNKTMVTKNWTNKVGISQFPNNAHESILLINGDCKRLFQKPSPPPFRVASCRLGVGYRH